MVRERKIIRGTVAIKKKIQRKNRGRQTGIDVYIHSMSFNCFKWHNDYTICSFNRRVRHTSFPFLGFLKLTQVKLHIHGQNYNTVQHI